MNRALHKDVFRVLFKDSSDSMVFFCLPRWEITEFNETFSSLLKYDIYETKKPNLSDILLNFDLSHPIQKFVQGDAPSVYIKDLPITDRYGIQFPVDIHVFRLEIETPTFLCKLISDSNQKESLRLNYEYISNISHELRGPLTNIHGSLEILQKNEGIHLNPDSITLLDVVNKNLNRMKILLENLLKLDIRKKSYNMEIISPCVSIQETLLFFESTLKDKNIVIHKEIDCAVRIRADKFEFSQILHNLISNAIKYTNEGAITIKVTKHSDTTVRLEISDTGVGIPKEYLPLVFQRFFRGSSAAGGVGGVGLGLWIVKELVERMQGTIQVFSSTEGTRLVLEFPLAAYAS